MEQRILGIYDYLKRNLSSIYKSIKIISTLQVQEVTADTAESN